MKVIDLKTFKETTLKDNEYIACCVGNFDGVHIGHKALIDATINNNLSLKSAVWTFDVHPLLLKNNKYKILTNTEERLEIFANYGINYAILENYENVCNVSQNDFVKDILYKECKVRYAVCGYNFAFGYKGLGKPIDFCNLFKELNVETKIIDQVCYNNIPVSSTIIRSLIEDGEIEKANILLGHPYSIKAIVESGNKIGRTLSFPTINQRFESNKVLPRFGVYASEVVIDKKKYDAISNIGIKPTVNKAQTSPLSETHIFSYDGDLYNSIIKTRYLSFIRDEKVFKNLDSLKSEIENNIKVAKNYHIGRI